MFHDLINLFYPRICNACDGELLNSEEILCTDCLHELPVTNFHQDNENPVKKVFRGRADLYLATSLLYFTKKGKVQNLIHNLKYRNQKEIGIFLGKWLGAELGSVPSYRTIDIVIPVPLHPKKLTLRGYNQVEGFARELSLALNALYIDDLLLKTNATSAQTFKERFARWGQMEETLITNNPTRLENKHVLITDDILTTGATLEACYSKLIKIRGIKISVATMAITQ